MTALGWAGVGLLAAAGALIVAEGVVMAVWMSRLSRRARALNALIDQERRLAQADVERLRIALEETARLWEPYQRALRWIRHPLVVALIASYRRRRAAA